MDTGRTVGVTTATWTVGIDHQGTVTGLVPQGQCRERTQLEELFGMRTIRVPPILALRGFSKLADSPPQTTNKHGH